MDYEKRYKEALEIAKKELQTCGSTDCDAARQIIRLFPELAESKDEKIRKTIVSVLEQNIRAGFDHSNGFKFTEMITWLEKKKDVNSKEYVFRPLLGCDINTAVIQAVEQQKLGNKIVLAFNGAYIPIEGKNTSEIIKEYYSWIEKQNINYSLVEEIKKRKDSFVREKEKAVSFNDKLSLGARIAVLEELLVFANEKQGKQKPVLDFKASNWYVSKVDGKIHDMTYNPADKAEPKFKVGDWILYSGDHYEGVRHITKIDENGYYIERNGLPHGIIPFNHEICMRLWTIQDAKDGDVLASNNSIFIFQEEYIAEKPIAYCGLMNGIFIKGEDACWTNEKCHPATNEQCETLFKAMHEDGYEWDAEKKELKKIEQKLAWSEEDEKMCQETIDWFEKKCFPYALEHDNPARESIRWLRTLKERLKGK